MNAANEQTIRGFFLTFRSVEYDMTMSFPALTNRALALDLAKMLSEVLLKLEVSVVSFSIAADELAEAVGRTQRTARRVVKAWEAESPGAAFLVAIGYWPFGKPEQE